MTKSLNCNDAARRKLETSGNAYFDIRIATEKKRKPSLEHFACITGEATRCRAGNTKTGEVSRLKFNGINTFLIIIFRHN